MSLEAIIYTPGNLQILDQLLLPTESKYLAVKNTEDGWRVINKMQVRGAPAIGIVAALSLAVELHQEDFDCAEDLISYVTKRMNYLVTARPTAVNIVDVQRKLAMLLKKRCADDDDVITMKERVLAELEGLQAADIAMNKAIGQHGAEHLLSSCSNQMVKVLTHCNTGALATGGYGTALGVVRRLHELGKLERCFCTETRPYNQGSRLTAYELVVDEIPSTLICDDMAGALMKEKGISAVFLGADRIVANGDTANKIGTYQLAVLCKHHNVPFYTVAPSTSIDLSMESGKEIVIEERSKTEMITVKGVPLAPEDIEVWNPAFDVTPAELITGGIVTEFGVFAPAELKEKLQEALHNKTTS